MSATAPLNGCCWKPTRRTWPPYLIVDGGTSLRLFAKSLPGSRNCGERTSTRSLARPPRTPAGFSVIGFCGGHRLISLEPAKLFSTWYDTLHGEGERTWKSCQRTEHRW